MQDLVTPNWMVAQGFSSTAAKRFWDKVEITDGCWIWKACKHHGYGILHRNKRNDGPISAHIFSWMLHNGPIPIGMCVLHNCPGGDNRACVRPNHLWLGTRGDNNRDTHQKRRTAVGEMLPQTKLKPANIPTIRELIDNHVTHREIAKNYGVSISAIAQIAVGKSWKWF